MNEFTDLINKTKEEIKKISKNNNELNRRYSSEEEDESEVWKDQKKQMREYNKKINLILGEKGSWENWAPDVDDLMKILLKAKLSALETAKDIFIKMLDENINLLKGTKERDASFNAGELKKLRIGDLEEIKSQLEGKGVDK